MFKRYAIRHVSNKNAVLKRIVSPPRLSDWTDAVDDAQIFKHQREAQDCADYITKVAFNTEVFEVEVNENDSRIIAEQRRWQSASDSVSDRYGIERTTIKITE